jgi:hypothetical protein
MAKAPALARAGKGELKLRITDPDGKSGSTAIFGPCRVSYAALFKTRNNKKRENKPEYSAVAMIDENDEEMLEFIEERIQHALKKKFGKAIAKFATCLKDGNKEMKETADGEDVEPMYPGFMFISTRADVDQPPLLYKPGSAEPLDATSATDWVSGDWAYFKLDFFGYDNENKGVSTRLKAVQFCAKDEPFGKGGQDADKVADEFGEVDGVDEESQSKKRGSSNDDDDDDGDKKATVTKAKKKSFLD